MKKLATTRPSPPSSSLYCGIVGTKSNETDPIAAVSSTDITTRDEKTIRNKRDDDQDFNLKRGVGLSSQDPSTSSRKRTRNYTLLSMAWLSSLFLVNALFEILEQHLSLSDTSDTSTNNNKSLALSSMMSNIPPSLIGPPSSQPYLPSKSSKATSGISESDIHHSPSSSSNDLCYPISNNYYVPEASSIWKNHIPRIHESSQHPQDKSYEFHDFFAILLQRMSGTSNIGDTTIRKDSEEEGATNDHDPSAYYTMAPNLFSSSVQGTVRDWQHVRHLIQIVQRRRRYFLSSSSTWSNEQKNNDTPPPPPLQILVLGGSVSLGVVCRFNPVKKYNPSRKACAWPYRFEQFINNVMGFPAVQVENISMGGMNTEIGTLLLKFGLFSANMPQPDVVINAYSTNDMHYNTIKMIESRNQTMEGAILEMIEDFVREVRTSTESSSAAASIDIDDTTINCSDQQPSATTSSNSDNPGYPFLIWIDDYIGNNHDNVWQSMTISRVLSRLSNYYGFPVVGYADAVRDMVYKDTHERWISPVWYDNKKQYVSEIHPGTGGHMAIAWTVAYRFLHIFTTFCTEQQDAVRTMTQETRTREHDDDNHRNPHGYVRGGSYPSLLNNDKKYDGDTKHPPIASTITSLQRALPPLLHSATIGTISNQWEDERVRANEHNNKHIRESQAQTSVRTDVVNKADCSTTTSKKKNHSKEKPCLYSWIGGLSPANDAEKLRKYLDGYCLLGKNEKEMSEDASITSSNGWEVVSDYKKIGLSPIEPVRFITTNSEGEGKESIVGPKLDFQFVDIDQPVRSVHWLVMKSYGERWEHSRIRVTIYRRGGDKRGSSATTMALAAEPTIIEGFHNKTTSESYPVSITLEEPFNVGDTLFINVELLSGQTFKITGMALCSKT